MLEQGETEVDDYQVKDSVLVLLDARKSNAIKAMSSGIAGADWSVKVIGSACDSSYAYHVTRIHWSFQGCRRTMLHMTRICRLCQGTPISKVKGPWHINISSDHKYRTTRSLCKRSKPLPVEICDLAVFSRSVLSLFCIFLFLLLFVFQSFDLTICVLSSAAYCSAVFSSWFWKNDLN